MILVFLSACFLAQSNAAGMAVICDSPKTCADCMTAAPDQQAYLLNQHIESRLYNIKARQTLDGLVMTHYTKRGEVLRQAATEAGLRECAFADLMDKLVAEEGE